MIRFVRSLALAIAVIMTSAVGPMTGAPSHLASAADARWQWSDNGHSVTVESSVMKVRFAYGGRGAGEFVGQGTGGGGRDGSIVELYWKPTGPNRNLVFRNGAWGSGYDALDVWEADNSAVDQGSFEDPDISSNRHGTVTAHRVEQDAAGNLHVYFTVKFAAWLIERHFVLGLDSIDVHADLQVVEPGHWNYLGHRFNVAAGRYAGPGGNAAGANYAGNGETYRSWTDGINRYNGRPIGPGWVYDQTIRPDSRVNRIAHQFRRTDTFMGFTLVDRNGDDPTVTVALQSPTDWQGPFATIARAVARHPLSPVDHYESYVETAIYRHGWSPAGLVQAGTTWFYMTSPGDGDIYGRRGYWSQELGSWHEHFRLTLSGSEPNS